MSSRKHKFKFKKGIPNIAEEPKKETAMGGQHTETFEQAEVKSNAGTTDVTRYEFHLSKGNVHVHDRTTGLKVEVPLVDWYKGWGKIHSGGITNFPEWNYTDMKNKTHLIITTVLNISTGDVEVESLISLHKVASVNPTYQALSNFHQSLMGGK